MNDVTAQAILAALESIESVVPADDVMQFTAGCAATALLNASGAACRQFMPLADGTITIVTSSGNRRTITVTQCVAEVVRATELVSSTVALKVYW